MACVSMPLTVFIHYIRHMKEHLLKDLEDKATVAIDDIDFVLTEPAIWDDTAKMFMREAAVKAGIKTAQLRIALESEAASICCRFTDLDLTEIDKTFFMAEKEKGVKYMLVDLGDGTADVTVHQLNKDGMLEEIVPASGDSWGGSCIDREFYDCLQELFGEKVMDIFDTDSDYIEDYHDFWQHFETKKKSFDIKRTEKQEKNVKK